MKLKIIKACVMVFLVTFVITDSNARLASQQHSSTKNEITRLLTIVSDENLRKEDP